MFNNKFYEKGTKIIILKPKGFLENSLLNIIEIGEENVGIILESKKEKYKTNHKLGLDYYFYHYQIMLKNGETIEIETDSYEKNQEIVIYDVETYLHEHKGLLDIHEKEIGKIQKNLDFLEKVN